MVVITDPFLDALAGIHLKKKTGPKPKPKTARIPKFVDRYKALAALGYPPSVIAQRLMLTPDDVLLCQQVLTSHKSSLCPGMGHGQQPNS